MRTASSDEDIDFSSSIQPVTSARSRAQIYEPAIADAEVRERLFNSRVSDAELQAVKNKKVNVFYKNQNALIDMYAQFDESFRREDDAASVEPGIPRIAKFTINLGFICNIFLLVVKVYAAATSGSMAVLAAAVDSTLDFFAGSVLIITAKVIEKRDPMRYPAGKRRMEPLGIVVFACVMGTAALEVILQSAEELFKGNPKLTIENVVLIILGITVGLKILLVIFCYVVSKSIPESQRELVDTMVSDHKNDILSNTIAAITAVVGARYVWWIDPLGGIIISLLIIRTWVKNGFSQLMKLTGRSAPPEVIRALTYVVHQHYQNSKVDTVRAYYHSNGFLVEVDIVLPRDMPLREAHDIGESLQIKLEKLEIVERAFVHLDFEYEHAPEHKPL